LTSSVRPAQVSSEELRSPLELLHPDGAVDRVFVLGSACQPELARSRASSGGARALVVLAPSANECRERRWLEEAVAKLAAIVDANSIAYVAVPLLWRRRALALLRSAGLCPSGTFVHLPNRRKSAHLVPAQAGPLRHAVATLMVTRRWKRRLARLAFSQQWVTSHVGDLLPSSGFVAARPGAPLPSSWVARGQTGSGVFRSATLSLSSGGASAVLHAFFQGSDNPILVAKLGLTERTRRARAHEAEMVERLAPGASAAEVDVPEIAGVAASGGGFLQTAVAGRPVAALLADDPRLLPEVLTAITGWLERWQLATRRFATFDDEIAEGVLGPARNLAPDLQSGSRYLSRLESLCGRLRGVSIPLVAAHNDLTMVNILRRGDGRLGVVDWEVADERALPLTDFFYAAADAVAASSRYADRARSFQDTFLIEGRTRSFVSTLSARLCQRLEVDPEFMSLCFHSCWLGHATNEARSSRKPLQARPFLAIAELLAEQLRQRGDDP
jgi:hypothetical protein